MYTVYCKQEFINLSIVGQEFDEQRLRRERRKENKRKMVVSGSIFLTHSLFNINTNLMSLSSILGGNNTKKDKCFFGKNTVSIDWTPKVY